jgi:hypothetical protein
MAGTAKAALNRPAAMKCLLTKSAPYCSDDHGYISAACAPHIWICHSRRWIVDSGEKTGRPGV